MLKRSIEGFTAREGVEYSALWFNASGLQRALAFRDKLTLAGFDFAERIRAFHDQEPQSRPRRKIEAMRKILCARIGKPACRSAKIIVMAAFGCNYQETSRRRR